MEIWHLWTYFSWGFGSAGLVVVLGDLKNLFNQRDSMTLRLQALRHVRRVAC